MPNSGHAIMPNRHNSLTLRHLRLAHVFTAAPRARAAAPHVFTAAPRARAAPLYRLNSTSALTLWLYTLICVQFTSSYILSEMCVGDCGLLDLFTDEQR